MLVVGWVSMVQRVQLYDSSQKTEALSGRKSSRVERVVRRDSWPRQHWTLRFEDFPE